VSRVGTYEDKISVMIDIFAFGLLLLYVFIDYYNLLESKKETYVVDRLTQLKDYLDDPYSIVSLLLFMLVVYLIIYFLRISMDKNESIAIMLIHNVVFILMILMIIINFLKYFFQINVVDIVLTKHVIPYVENKLNPTTGPEPTEPIESFESFESLDSLDSYRPMYESSYTNDRNRELFASYTIG
jgi:hypothetical protein